MLGRNNSPPTQKHVPSSEEFLFQRMDTGNLFPTYSKNDDYTNNDAGNNTNTECWATRKTGLKVDSLR